MVKCQPFSLTIFSLSSYTFITVQEMRKSFSATMGRMNILFVCTGNLCRSPLAEGYMRKILADKGLLEVKVSSAGCWAGNGAPVSEGAQRVAEENGFQLSAHRSRPVTPEMVAQAGIVAVMDEIQREEVVNLAPAEEDKVVLLRSFAPDGTTQSSIPDPYGADLDSFRYVFQLIKESVDGLYRSLVASGKVKPPKGK